MPKLPDPFSTKPTKEQIQTTREILDAIFKDPQVKYGLLEFSKLKIEEAITIFEKGGRQIKRFSRKRHRRYYQNAGCKKCQGRYSGRRFGNFASCFQADIKR